MPRYGWADTATANNGVRYIFAQPELSERQERTLLLLHGLGNSLSMWNGVARELVVSRSILAVDIPGFGLSRPPNGVWSVRSLTTPIIELLDQLHITEIDIVGHSFGALLAIALANRMPDRVGSIDLLNGTVFTALEVMRLPLRGLLHPVVAGSLLAQFAGGSIPMSRSSARAISYNFWARTALLWPFMADPGHVNPEVLFEGLEGNRGGVAAARSAFLAVEFDLRRECRQLTNGVRIIWGMRDFLIEERDVEEATRLIPCVRDVVRLPDCGHWPMIEDPGLVAAILKI